MPRVPAADSALNRLQHYVTGNKTDAAVQAVGTTKSIIAYVKGLIANAVAVEAAGTADIDISAGDYTSFLTLLTIAAAAGKPLTDCWLHFDWHKATTGFHAVATASDTLDCIVMMKTDGTNLRHAQAFTQVTAAASPADTAQGQRIHIGPIGATETCVVKVKVSAERGDVEIPYRILYRGAAPTITPVAAGA